MGVKEKLTAIADKIRGKTRKTDGLNLDEMAQGIDEVFEAGKKAEYDAFWDVYQGNGSLTYYTQMFSGYGWRDSTFKPKYDIIPEGRINNMFHQSRIVDVKQALLNSGVIMDLSKATNATTAFSTNTKLEVLPKIDLSSATNAQQIFYGDTSLTSIDELVVSEKLAFDRCFASCSALVHMMVTGTIAQNGFNVQWATKLDKESITSIVNALSTTISGLSVTLSKTAVNTAFETSAGAANGSTSAEWTTLAGTKSNWTINLV